MTAREATILSLNEILGTTLTDYGEKEAMRIYDESMEKVAEALRKCADEIYTATETYDAQAEKLLAKIEADREDGIEMTDAGRAAFVWRVQGGAINIMEMLASIKRDTRLLDYFAQVGWAVEGADGESLNDLDFYRPGDIISDFTCYEVPDEER